MVKGEFKMDEQKNTEFEVETEHKGTINDMPDEEPKQTKKEDGIFDQFKKGVDIKID